MRGRRAFSLLEMSLALALAALMILLMALFGPSLLRTWRRCDVQSEVQRTALLCLMQINSELAQGYGPSLQNPADKLSFASRVDAYGVPQYDVTCEPLWQKWVLYHRDPVAQKLWRRYDIWPTPSPRVNPLQYTPCVTFVEKKVAENLTRFETQILANGRIQLNLTVEKDGEKASLQSILEGLGEESD